MTGKLLLASLAGAAILFVWGFLFWGMADGFGSRAPIPNEDAITTVLRESITESGVYRYPGMDQSIEGWEERYETQLQQGPIYTVSYHAGGAEPMNVGLMITGFVQWFIAAFILCLILNMAIGSLATYGRRLAFIFLAGLFASLTICPTEAIWMYDSWNLAFMNILYYTVGWLLAGLAIAKMVKPRLTPAT